MDKKCYIFGAGDLYIDELSVPSDSLVICADGGMYHAKTLSVTPDVFIGDFDSGDISDTTDNRIIYPTEKDYTDMFLAVEYGVSKGYSFFEIYGALGGKRIEHTVANLQMLGYFAKKDIGIRLHGNGEIVTAYTANTENTKIIAFDSSKHGYISLFALGGNVEKVSISGLKYSLDNAKLTTDFPIGISNEFIGKNSTISFSGGTVLLIYNE